MEKNNLITFLGVLISILALCVSCLTLWISHLRRGKIMMMRPAIFFFGWDQVGSPLPKIFLRSLLFSNANRGRVLENMYLLVRSPKGETVFNFWGHANSGPGSLTRGSGLFISKDGYLADHHFNPEPRTDVTDSYPPGEYEIKVIVRQFGDSADITLGRYNLQLDQRWSTSLGSKIDGVLWTFNPRDQTYHANTSPRSRQL
jgi:hypothetical protein